jgi:tetratricopeptide (TPR) repeat protein
MKPIVWLGLLYCASAVSAPPDIASASAEGPGGVAVMNGGTVNVHVGVTVEDIERVIEAKGQERERQLRELTRKVNALEKSRRSDEAEIASEEQVENVLAASQDKRVPRAEWADRLVQLVLRYKALQSRLRSMAASGEQIRRLLERVQLTQDPDEADGLLEQTARLALDCAQTSKQQGKELDRQAANVTVRRAYLAQRRMDRMRAAQLFQEAFQDRRGDIDPEAVGWLWEAGDIWADLGDATRAIAIYSEAYSEANANLAREPSNTEWQRAVAGSDQMLGLAFLSEGHADEARLRFEESIHILERLPAENRSGSAPDALVRSYRLMARAWQAMGHISVALQEFQSAFSIAVAVATLDPDNPFLQREVLISAGDLASLQHDEQLDATVAIESMRRLLSDARQSAEAHPIFVDWKWNQAVALQNLARSEGGWEAKVEDYTQALRIYTELDDDCSDFKSWKGDILAIREILADELIDQNQFDAGLAQLRSGLQVAQVLIGADPSNANLQGRLAALHAQIGRALDSQGDSTGALNEYQTTGALLEHLTSLAPTKLEWQDARWRNDDRMGQTLSERKSFTEAYRVYQDGLKIAQEFTDRFPGNNDWQAYLLESLKSLAKLSNDDNNPAEAIKMFRAALELAQKFARTKPHNTYWACNVVWSSAKLGELLEAKGHYIRASWLYRDAIAEERQLVEEHPDTMRWRDGLRSLWSGLGNIYLHHHRLAAAARSYRQAALVAKVLVDENATDFSLTLDVARLSLMLIDLNLGTADDWVMLQRGLEASGQLEQSKLLTVDQKAQSAFIRDKLVAGGVVPPPLQAPLTYASARLPLYTLATTPESNSTIFPLMGSGSATGMFH